MNITKAYNRFKSSETIFRCSICDSQMEFRNENSLVCLQNHCFDLSKHGYVNFVPNQNKVKYTKSLFENRRSIFQSGFYDPLIKSIEHSINKYFNTPSHTSVLDVGCGEGFFISKLFGNNKQAGDVFAMDICKDAIVLAAKGNNDIKWIVSDLSNIPLKSNSIDLILNIFTPANYSEFSRIMSDNGFLIKVVPGKYYLKEIRECAKEQLINQDYSNEQVLQVFQNNMVCLDKENLFYQLPVTKSDFENFLKMTPMMFNIDTDKIKFHDIKQITIDVEIVIGQKSITPQA